MYISLAEIRVVPIRLGTGTNQVVFLQKMRAAGPGREECLSVSPRTGVFPDSLLGGGGVLCSSSLLLERWNN